MVVCFGDELCCFRSGRDQQQGEGVPGNVIY